MFSFELGDLHPHVLAIPFVLFAIGIALNALIRELDRKEERIYFAQSLISEELSLKDSAMVRWILSSDFWLTAVCVGGLLFQNMWDFPFYFGLYCLCITAAQLHNFGWNRRALTAFFETALPLVQPVSCFTIYSSSVFHPRQAGSSPAVFL